MSCVRCGKGVYGNSNLCYGWCQGLHDVPVLNKVNAKKKHFLSDADIEPYRLHRYGMTIGYPEDSLLQVVQNYLADPESERYKMYIKRKATMERRQQAQEKAQITRAHNAVKKQNARDERNNQINDWMDEQQFEHSWHVRRNDLFHDYIRGKIIDFDHVTTQLIDFHKQYSEEVLRQNVNCQVNDILEKIQNFNTTLENNIRYNQQPDYLNTPAETIGDKVIKETQQMLIQFWNTPQADMDHRQQEFDKSFSIMKKKYQGMHFINDLQPIPCYIRQLYIYGGDKLVISMVNNNLMTLEEMTTFAVLNRTYDIWDAESRELFLQYATDRMATVGQSCDSD